MAKGYGAYVSGVDKVQINLKRAKNKLLDKIAEAVEKTAVFAENHAKRGHARNHDPHAKKRFISQHGAAGLVGSIGSELTEVSNTNIEAQVFATKEYAPFVELGTSKTKPYPFLLPAKLASADVLKKNLGNINL